MKGGARMWKDVPGYEGLYVINESGDVITVKTGYKKKWRPNRRGYPWVDLCRDNTTRQFLVHRLVAMAFIPNPNNYPIVMHLDNNKWNPHVSNLKWGTYSENTMQAYREGIVKTPSGPNVYEIYKGNDVGGYRTRGYKDTIQTIGYGTNGTIGNLLRYSTTIKEGRFEGYQIRKAEKIKPFIVNR